VVDDVVAGARAAIRTREAGIANGASGSTGPGGAA